MSEVGFGELVEWVWLLVWIRFVVKIVGGIGWYICYCVVVAFGDC